MGGRALQHELQDHNQVSSGPGTGRWPLRCGGPPLAVVTVYCSDRQCGVGRLQHGQRTPARSAAPQKTSAVSAVPACKRSTWRFITRKPHLLRLPKPPASAVNWKSPASDQSSRPYQLPLPLWLIPTAHQHPRVLEESSVPALSFPRQQSEADDRSAPLCSFPDVDTYCRPSRYVRPIGEGEGPVLLDINTSGKSSSRPDRCTREEVYKCSPWSKKYSSSRS